MREGGFDFFFWFAFKVYFYCSDEDVMAGVNVYRTELFGRVGGEKLQHVA